MVSLLCLHCKTLNSPLQTLHIQAILNYRFAHSLIFITRKISYLTNPLVYWI